MHQERKREHLRISLGQDVGCSSVTTGLERYHLIHQALPDINLEDIDTSTHLLGKCVQVPLIVSAMTGGTPEARIINHRLAEAAQSSGIGMALGSQRAALDDPTVADTYRVRHLAPQILLLANLGAVQLNYGYGLSECRQAVEMIDADALVLHLNPLQEALQPEGNTGFSGLLGRIEAVCRGLHVPVVVKEVGWGISGSIAKQLADAGVTAIDVAGAGGTSWSRVEMHRSRTNHQRAVARAFSGWGIPTAESLLEVRRAVPEVPVLASGGIRDGIDIAKALALGATACGVARPFLQAASDSSAAVANLVSVLADQLRTAMFAVGARDVPSLRRVPLTRQSETGTSLEMEGSRR